MRHVLLVVRDGLETAFEIEAFEELGGAILVRGRPPFDLRESFSATIDGQPVFKVTYTSRGPGDGDTRYEFG